MALSENDRLDAVGRGHRLPVAGLLSLTAILRQRGALIVLVTGVFALAGLLYVSLSTPRYLASGRILLELPDTERDASVLTSQPILNRVIEAEKLETDPLFGARRNGSLSLLLSGLGLSPAADPHALALRALERSVSVTRDGGTNAMEVRAVTRDGERSMRLVNAIMDAYIEKEASAQSGLVRRAEEPRDPQLDLLQTRLKDAEQRYDKYRDGPGKSVPNDLTAAEKLVAGLADRLAAAEAKVNNSRAALAQARRAGDRADPDTFRGGTIGTLRHRYLAAKRLQDHLALTLGPRHPDLVIAKLQATEAKRSLDGAVRARSGERVQSAAVEIERVRTVVADLKRRLEVARKDLSRAIDGSSRLSDLERDVADSRAAYEAYLSKSRDLSVQQPTASPESRIISRATPPQGSIGTSRLIVLLGSILLGAVIGVLVALLLSLRPEWTLRTGVSRVDGLLNPSS